MASIDELKSALDAACLKVQALNDAGEAGTEAACTAQAEADAAQVAYQAGLSGEVA